MSAINTGKVASFMEKYGLLLLFATIASLVLFTPDAVAGTGGTEFDDVWDTVKDWTQGTLGRIIAGSMILVGIVGGIARQSLMAFALGIGGGMGLYNAPTVVEAVLGATIEVSNAVGPQTIALANGLL